MVSQSQFALVEQFIHVGQKEAEWHVLDCMSVKGKISRLIGFNWIDRYDVEHSRVNRIV